MSKTTRPFRKLPGVSKENDAYAIKHDRRPFVFNFTTVKGSTLTYQGNVKQEHVDELVKMFDRLNKLAQEK